jgi:hypothetical protein
MLKMRQVRQPDYFGARHHVQGIRLVYHGLFRQDEAADRRNIKTNTHGHDNSPIWFISHPVSVSFVVAGSSISFTTGLWRSFQLFYSIDQQHTCIQYKFKLKVDRLR